MKPYASLVAFKGNPRRLEVHGPILGIQILALREQGKPVADKWTGIITPVSQISDAMCYMGSTDN